MCAQRVPSVRRHTRSCVRAYSLNATPSFVNEYPLGPLFRKMSNPFRSTRVWDGQAAAHTRVKRNEHTPTRAHSRTHPHKRTHRHRCHATTVWQRRRAAGAAGFSVRRRRDAAGARNAATWQVTVFILGTGEADVNAQDAAKQATHPIRARPGLVALSPAACNLDHSSTLEHVSTPLCSPGVLKYPLSAQPRPPGSPMRFVRLPHRARGGSHPRSQSWRRCGPVPAQMWQHSGHSRSPRRAVRVPRVVQGTMVLRDN
jgi:hypothetical protein